MVKNGRRQNEINHGGRRRRETRSQEEGCCGDDRKPGSRENEIKPLHIMTMLWLAKGAGMQLGQHLKYAVCETAKPFDQVTRQVLPRWTSEGTRYSSTCLINQLFPPLPHLAHFITSQ